MKSSLQFTSIFGEYLSATNKEPDVVELRPVGVRVAAEVDVLDGGALGRLVDAYDEHAVPANEERRVRVHHAQHAHCSASTAIIYETGKHIESAFGRTHRRACRSSAPPTPPRRRPAACTSASWAARGTSRASPA